MPGALEAFTSAGSKLAISAALPTTLDDTGYEALTFTEIAEITDQGSTGRTYAVVQHQPLSKRGVVKLKGSYNDGTKTVQAAFAPGDPGQILLATALDDDAFYSFRETLQDGTIEFFQAQVVSAPFNVGTADTVTGTTFTLEIKSGSLVRVLPT